MGISRSRMSATDNLQIVAAIGDHIAHDREDELVIRILRVTPNASWHGVIEEIAGTSNDPDNLYTLWIREDHAFMGRFKPPNPKKSLIQQLTDVEEDSDQMKQFLVGCGTTILSDNGDEENDDDSIQCASCNKWKAQDSFSKSQLRTKGSMARCKHCIQMGKKPSW